MADNIGTAVKFKLGTQASLNTLKASQKGWEVGTFYLTSDSSRLYIGQADELALLNKSVEIYADLETLKKKTTTSTEGDIAYCVFENVLAYYNGTTWAQINPDDDTILTAIVQTVGTVTDGVKVTTTGTNNDDTAKVTGSEITIKGSKGAKVAADGTKGITVTGDTYTLSAETHTGAENDVDLKLTSALGQDASTVHVKGDGSVTVSKTTDGGIKISGEDTTLKDLTLGLGANGALTVSVSDTSSVTPISRTKNLGYYVGGDFVGIGSTDTTKVDLPVYSKEEVDTLINKLDGMTYRGPIGSGQKFTMSSTYVVQENGTPTDIHIGDMFLVQGDVTYGADLTASTGDLLIAAAKDGKTETNGVLAAADVEWTYIPSGDDAPIDTTYIFKANKSDNSMTVTSSNGGGIVGKISFTEGNGISIESTTSAGQNPNQLGVTIKHDTVTTIPATSKQDLGNGDSFTAIDSITYENGHITGINTKTVTTPEYLPGPDVGSNTTDNKTATVKHTLLVNGQTVSHDSAKMVLTSDTLKLSASGNTVTADLVWGSF